MKRQSLVGSIILVLCAGCGGDSPPAATRPVPPASDAAFDALEREYVVYFLQRFPVVATYLGGANFDSSLVGIDGKLRDYSADGLKQEDARLAELKQRFAALDDGALSAPRRIDKRVALGQIEFLLRLHGVRRHQQRSLDSYMDEPFRGVDWQIQGMTSSGEKTYGTVEEWRRVIERVRAVPAYLDVAKSQLHAGIASNNTPDWRVLKMYGLQSSIASAEYFASTLPEIAADAVTGDMRDALLSDLRTAGKNASDAFLRFRGDIVKTFFNDPRRDAVSGLKAAFREDRFAMGVDEYDWALRNNLRLTSSAAQLYDESWPAIERTRTQMIELAGQIAAARGIEAAGDDSALVAEVFDVLSKDAPATDEQMIRNYVQIGGKLVDYARRTDLFVVPDDYQLDVTMTPAPLRASIGGAAYYSAPPFKSSGVGRFYVTPSGNDLRALQRRHNAYSIAIIAAHEGFPGHDWHHQVMKQYRDQISPVRWLTPGAVEDSSSMWEDSLTAEGWALYSEGLIGEPRRAGSTGFYSTEQRLYQLRSQLERKLRVRLDSGLHTSRLAFDEAVTLVSETMDFIPGSCSDAKELSAPAKAASCKAALTAVNRYARWPTQAITYQVGKDQLVALRERAQRELGDRFSEQRFHLEFMKQGTIAPDYFADELIHALGQPLR